MNVEAGELAVQAVDRFLERDDVAAVVEGDDLVRKALAGLSIDLEARNAGLAEAAQRHDEPVGRHPSLEEGKALEDECVSFHANRCCTDEPTVVGEAERAFAGDDDPCSVRRPHLHDDREAVGARASREEAEQHEAEPSKDAEPFHRFKNREEPCENGVNRPRGWFSPTAVA
jgi:hypothetical protein